MALALTQAAGIGPVLALATGFGVCAAVLQPGLGAIVPRLVGPGVAPASRGRPGGRPRQPGGLTRANGYLQAATWGGFTLGPLLAALFIAAGGTGLALVGVAAIYALGAARAVGAAAGAAGPAGRPGRYRARTGSPRS